MAEVPESFVHNASNDLKRIANFARGIIALDEAVAQFGGLRQAAEDATKRLVVLRSEVDALEVRKAELDQVEVQLAERKAELDRVTEAHATFLKRMIGASS